MTIRTSLLAALMLGASSCAMLPTDQTAPVDEPATPVVEALPGGIVSVEKVEAKDGEILIPYEKFLLPNGLTLVLHEDKSDPLVHVDVTYHVGSSREEPGRSGFAHFFEHMMFQGSENVADEEHFKIVSESGGTLNGTTNTDRTNYFETVPSNQLEKMLWLEADRMGYFLDAVTEEKFEVQRETVKNERNQNYDNRPYGLLFEKVSEALFPKGHPYSWLTIGYIEDLNRADLDDLKRFFLRWYGPNNATLTIGGDLDRQQTLEWVAKYFGSIPTGPAVDPLPKTPVTLDADRYISMEDNVSLPLVYMTFPTVQARHPDEAPLDVLNSILGEGRTSLMYKNLVKDGKAVQAWASHPCSELACSFSIGALPNPASGQSLADLEKVIRDSLKEFETRGVEDDDLTRVKAGIYAGNVFGLESVSGKVRQLAFYETFTGSPNYTQQDIQRYEAVTKEDVMRVYETYIKDKPSVIMSIVPKGQADAIAAPDNWTMYERDFPTPDDDGALQMRYAAKTFDRSVQPPAGDNNPSVKLPDTWRSELANGVEILGAANSETPTTAISLRIEAGERSDPLDKLGLASLTAEMLGESTRNSTNEELSNRLAKLGSSVSVNSGARYSTVGVRSLTENLDDTLAIAKERLLEPAFKQEDFDRLKEQRLQAIEQRKTQASATAGTVFSLLLFGQDNPSAHSGLGTKETVEAITLDDVKAFYAENYTPSIASVIAVSDLSQAELVEKLAPFGEWQGPDVTPAGMADFPELAAKTLYLVDKEDAAQSEIRIGKRGLTYDATGEYYRTRLMNYILGGAFNSRINLNLREDKGYTYGASSYFSGSNLSGSYVARAGVRSNVTAEAIQEMIEEISEYAESGITEDELAFTKSAIGQSEALDYETPYDKLGFLSQILTYNLPEGFVDEQNKILAEITADEINALAAKHLQLDEMIIVVVGDTAKIKPDLEELSEAFGYDIIELDGQAMATEPQRPVLSAK